jgi:hypothetical protein
MKTPPKKQKNDNLHKAKQEKNDEFYTQMSDIENEMWEYYYPNNNFEGKTIYCNCDDPRVSNFFKYFARQFELFKLKKLICTCYKNNDTDIFSTKEMEQGAKLIYTGDMDGNKIYDHQEAATWTLKGDGDFRSAECIELLKESDIVCTNPPFSLFREYVAQLIEFDKKFIIIGNMNAITYKEIFPLIKENKLWLGVVSGAKKYIKPDGTFQNMGNTCWFTNLDINKRHEELILWKKYNQEEYLKYDNYDAINVDKTAEIPCDYDGVMGVPISFLDKYNPEQFEIIGLDRYAEKNTMPNKRMHINGKEIYARILIRRKK